MKNRKFIEDIRSSLPVLTESLIQESTTTLPFAVGDTALAEFTGRGAGQYRRLTINSIKLFAEDEEGAGIEFFYILNNGKFVSDPSTDTPASVLIKDDGRNIDDEELS